MSHKIDPGYQVRLDYIRKLNRLGFNIIHIDNTYFVFTTFDPAEEHILEHTLLGFDVTPLIEAGVNASSQTDDMSVKQKILGMTELRREFHKDITYIKYLSYGS